MAYSPEVRPIMRIVGLDGLDLQYITHVHALF